MAFCNERTENADKVGNALFYQIKVFKSKVYNLWGGAHTKCGNTKPTKQHHMKFSFFEAVSEKRLQRRCGLYIFFQGFVDPDSSYPGGGRVLPSVNQQRDRCLFYELLLLFLTSICQDRAELWEGVATSTQCYFKLTSLSCLLSHVLNKRLKNTPTKCKLFPQFVCSGYAKRGMTFFQVNPWASNLLLFFSLGIKGNKIARLEKAAASLEQSEWKSAHYMLVCSDNAKNTPRVL